MALQAMSGSHHFVGKIHSVCVNSVSTVIYLAQAAVCLDCYNGLKDPQMSKQGTASRRNYRTLRILQKLDIIMRLESGKII